MNYSVIDNEQSRAQNIVSPCINSILLFQRETQNTDTKNVQKHEQWNLRPKSSKSKCQHLNFSPYQHINKPNLKNSNKTYLNNSQTFCYNDDQSNKSYQRYSKNNVVNDNGEFRFKNFQPFSKDEIRFPNSFHFSHYDKFDKCYNYTKSLLSEAVVSEKKYKVRPQANVSDILRTVLPREILQVNLDNVNNCRRERSCSAMPRSENERSRQNKWHRSESESSSPSTEFIDAKARNLTYKLCKLLWSLARGDWSRLCQKCFSGYNSRFERYMATSDILTQYITMLQSIHILISSPKFMRDLELLHTNKELVVLVGNYFHCLFELFEVVKSKNEFHYFPDVYGWFGPNEPAQSQFIYVKTMPLEDTPLEIPVNGMYAILKAFKPILLTPSSVIRDALFRNFVTLVSIELHNAANDFKIYNNRMGENFEFENQINVGTRANTKSILKQPSKQSKLMNHVTFGPARYRDIIFNNSWDTMEWDDIVDEVYDTSDSFKHERTLRRMQIENCKKNGEELMITPREMYPTRRNIVPKTGFVKEITGGYENPRTVLKLSPPESPDLDNDEDQTSDITKNTSNSCQPSLPINFHHFQMNSMNECWKYDFLRWRHKSVHYILNFCCQS